MAKRKKHKIFYKYECQLTGDQYKLTRKAENEDDLMSVMGYYELHPEEDDRPVAVKKQLGIEIEPDSNS